MKKFDTVVNEVVIRITEKRKELYGKISRQEINKIIDAVCEEYDFKGNEFSICYTLGIA